jgi:hypothetical protein
MVMTWTRAGQYLLKPTLIWDKIHALLHAREPWISPLAVGYCSRHLNRNQVGLEWGSGRSTRWFGEHLGKLLSIEHNAHWHAKVSEMTRGMPNVKCRLIALEHPEDEPTRPDYDPVPAYVVVANEFSDASLDFVVVDGHYRQACIKQALPKIKPGGLLLLDDFGFLPMHEWGVPDSWVVVHKSSTSFKDTIIWQKPSRV